MSWKNAEIVCFFSLSAFRIPKCEHLRSEGYLQEFIHGFSVFVNGFGSTGKGVDLNIETFVCDGSDNGDAF